VLTTFLSSLVAGFLFAFAVVIMPGIKNLNDKEFIRSFQVMDKVIQDNQPIFILVWVGSIFAFIATIIFGFLEISNFYSHPLIFIFLLYFLGVQLPTVIINIPLNNKIQSLNVDKLNEAELKRAREDFELKWNKSNIFRSIISGLVSVLLIIAVFEL